MLRAVKAEPARAWKVSELSKLAGASRAAFARLFQAAVGTSPQRWLRAERLEHAARLLRQTSAPLSEIAPLVGYQSEFALSRAFKRRHGVAPGHYRKGVSRVVCTAMAA